MSSGLQDSQPVAAHTSRRAKSVPAAMLADRSARKEVRVTASFWGSFQIEKKLSMIGHTF